MRYGLAVSVTSAAFSHPVLPLGRTGQQHLHPAVAALLLHQEDLRHLRGGDGRVVEPRVVELARRRVVAGLRRRRRRCVISGFTVAMYDVVARRRGGDGRRRWWTPSLAEGGLRRRRRRTRRARARARRDTTENVVNRRSTGARLPADPGYGAARGAPGGGRGNRGARPPGPAVRALRRGVRTGRPAPGPTPAHALRRTRARRSASSNSRGPRRARSTVGSSWRSTATPHPKPCSRSRWRRCAPRDCRPTRPRRSATWPRRCSPVTSSSTAWRELSDEKIVDGAHAGARHRTVDGRDVPHVPARPARRVAGRRPRRPQGVRRDPRPARHADAEARSRRSATRCGRTGRWRPGTAGGPPTPSSDRLLWITAALISRPDDGGRATPRPSPPRAPRRVGARGARGARRPRP